MKNKTILIILLALALICIPIVIIGIKDKRIVPEKVLSKQEFEAQRQAEKEKITKELINNNDSSKNNNQEDDYLTKEHERLKKESDEQYNKIENIIERFHSKEYKESKAKMIENQSKMSGDELYQQPYTKNIIHLVIDIIENKNIDSKEKETLKEFIKEQVVNYKDDVEMNEKMNKALNK